MTEGCQTRPYVPTSIQFPYAFRTGNCSSDDPYEEEVCGARVDVSPTTHPAAIRLTARRKSI
jgi:hypothetical protein